MANTKSQIKRNRQSERRRVRNKAVRSELKTRVKVALRAAEEGTENAEQLLRDAQKRIDMAAADGVLHRNAAARKKSRLAAQARKLAQPAS